MSAVLGAEPCKQHGIVELAEQRVVDLLHLGEAGEEAEGAATGDFQ